MENEKSLLKTETPREEVSPPNYETSKLDTTPSDKAERGELEGYRQTERPKRWGFDLFSCFEDFGTCLCATILPCMVYGQNKQRLNQDDDCCLYSGMYCIVDMSTASHCGCALAALDRQSIRKRQEIPGSLVEDAIASYFCLPCVLTQQKLELDCQDGTRIPSYLNQ